MSLGNILKKMERDSFSLRDKGTRFEELIKNWFLSAPLYCDDIKEIWLWNEFPYRNQFGGSDSGIDLVILTDKNEYQAVQCKFYSSDKHIDKADVDTFISTSAKLFEVDGIKVKFSSRLFVSTTNHWSKKASDLIENQEIPVTRISLNTLEDSGVDWDKLYLGNTGDKARKEKKKIREHQESALKNVHSHFKSANRGKLIMACGTGKTFTSLKIAENETNGNGLILFLVPSIALLGQTLREWSSDIEGKLYPICICSDSKITKKTNNDSTGMSVVDLALPATTDVNKIVSQLETLKDKEGLKVVFSTYQSIDVISRAQQEILAKDSTFGVFDLIVCDEAHRTTGVALANEEESNFIKVHDNEFIKAKKRLYMTATPRLYDDNSKSKAKENNAYLCSMDDRGIYGDEIYRIGFGEAVQRELLTDYKVLILTLNHSQVPREIQALISNGDIEFKIDDASKLMGCINGLSKQILDKEGIVKASDPNPMKRAVAFCRDIKTSKKITSDLNEFSNTYISSLKEEVQEKMVEVSSKHIDGGMNALERENLLSWLKQDSKNERECKILTNARCLSEGVDVPTLDAVLFLSAKNSQVDVVQSVGRVMRRAEGKKYGYIIIPVVVPADKKPEEALNDNETYKVVWSVLNALRAHDERFNAEINKIDLNKRKPQNILIGTVDNTGKERKYKENKYEVNERQMSLNMDIDRLQNAIYAKMVEKVGDRKYFERWAKDVARIAQIQIDRIRDLIARDKQCKKAFNKFIEGLQKNISPDIDEEQGIEMLSQHIITRPIFEALFEGYSFVKNNPISHSMQDILDFLLQGQIEKETEELNKFYEDIKFKIEKIDNAEGKQRIIVELYDKFFKTAFDKLVDKLGIVYTPVEVVDFIINSVEELLNKEFGRSLSDENVNILDPFTGTGTFISRLLQSRIIKNKDLERKYKYEIYANELVLLAYYIATVNIENVYHDLEKENSIEEVDYKEFEGICLTDTFQLSEDDNEIQMFDLAFKENSERVNRQKKAPLQVIIGNPPYTIGQSSANDNAQNKKYPKLDNKILETYSKESSAGLNKALYDAYIKAFRWATDRLDKTGGIIGFVTNGAWIDGGSTSGFRKVIEKEFTSIYVFNLRGNQRTSGELSRKEGGKIFGSGSRTPIAITFLIKNPNIKKEKASIYYHDIGDYLTREEKLKIISNFKSVKNIDWIILTPNQEGDWINQRNEKFDTFIPLIDKDNKNNKNTFFNISSNGVVTNRDTWVYSYSKGQLEKQMRDTIKFYNTQIDKIEKVRKTDENSDIEDIIDTNPNNISWSADLKKRANRLEKDIFDINEIKVSLYRPFSKQHLYYSKKWIERFSQQSKFKGVAIGMLGIGGKHNFSSLILKEIGDIQTFQNANFYPLYYSEESSNSTLFTSKENKKDGITDFIYNLAREKYGVPRITKEDIFYYVYGFLHNEDYRKEFEADLKKTIPKLPLVDEYQDFKKYSDIGRELAELHLNYETLERPEGIIVEGEELGNYRVEKMSFIKKGVKDTINYNSSITIKNIPLEAYDYQVNGKSAIEWIMERYAVITNKDSGITNDPNLWCDEHNDPKYILNLLLSIITLSLKTNELVKELPKVEF
ncbi:Predicted helicase [Fusobacterium necrogenes]|uniref:Predicted helicase n=2 Tax=Fusobacterium necrogenes TaxID=858 RepID=A0A377GWF3_9FUSO|nr:Predicted helicase [Fusobacterium necrogenes]